MAYFLLIICFTYFYVAITFNPEEVADNMKKYGGFIPGIRAGRPTAEYLDYVLSRITLPGSLYLGLIALHPDFIAFSALVSAVPELPVRWHGILIIVGVAWRRSSRSRPSCSSGTTKGSSGSATRGRGAHASATGKARSHPKRGDVGAAGTGGPSRCGQGDPG